MDFMGASFAYQGAAGGDFPRLGIVCSENRAHHNSGVLCTCAKAFHGTGPTQKLFGAQWLDW